MPMAIDDDAHVGTFTRAEVFAMRGLDLPPTAVPTCDDETVNPVAAVAELAPTNGHAPARACQGCGGSLAGRAESCRWCSPACREKYRPRRTATATHTRAQA